MASGTAFLILIPVLALAISQTSAFPTPAATEDEKTVYNRQLTEERPLQEQIAEADNVKAAVLSADTRGRVEANQAKAELENDDFTLLKSLAEGQRSKEANETPAKGSQGEEPFIPDESDSTKNRRLAEDYDSTKTGMDYDDPESFRQVDGSPLTAEDIVQKIASKIYEEDDRGVFDRIVSKLLKLGLITDSQAETLEYEVAEALQDLITKNAKNNEMEDLAMDYSRGDQDERSSNTNMDISDSPRRRYEEDEEEDEGAMDDEVEREAEGEGDELVEEGKEGEAEEENELSPDDGLQDLQYFPNFYRLLKSLDSEQDAQERETLITIMKTLIDFVKMMVKYGTITPEEGVSYLENLDAMIALQTKNKLGKSLGPANRSLLPATGKSPDDDDNTKEEAAKMQKEYENLKDSTKQEQAPTESSHPGKSETYLEAIRKNIEWLKKHNKEEGKDDYDLSKLRDFMDQQVDSYIDKGIIEKDEGETIKRIYGSL